MIRELLHQFRLALLIDQRHKTLVNAELLQVVIGDLYLGIHQRGADTIDVIFLFHKLVALRKSTGRLLCPAEIRSKGRRAGALLAMW